MFHCDQTACGAAPKQHRQCTCELGHNVTVQKKNRIYGHTSKHFQGGTI
jgi:hypothetical protein